MAPAVCLYSCLYLSQVAAGVATTPHTLPEHATLISNYASLFDVPLGRVPFAEEDHAMIMPYGIYIVLQETPRWLTRSCRLDSPNPQPLIAVIG